MILVLGGMAAFAAFWVALVWLSERFERVDRLTNWLITDEDPLERAYCARCAPDPVQREVL